MPDFLYLLFRIFLCLIATWAVSYLFWRYRFGSYYKVIGDITRWPIRERGQKIPHRKLPYSTEPPANIRKRFKFTDDTGWEPTFVESLPAIFSIIAVVTLVWWAT
jgi:hypothetical protein